MPFSFAASISASASMPARLASIKKRAHSPVKPPLWYTRPKEISLGASSSAHLRITIRRPCSLISVRRSPNSFSTLRASDVNENTSASQRPQPIASANARSVSNVNCSGTIYSTRSPFFISSAAMLLKYRLFPLPERPVSMLTRPMRITPFR